MTIVEIVVVALAIKVIYDLIKKKSGGGAQ